MVILRADASVSRQHSHLCIMAIVLQQAHFVSSAVLVTGTSHQAHGRMHHNGVASASPLRRPCPQAGYTEQPLQASDTWVLLHQTPAGLPSCRGVGVVGQYAFLDAVWASDYHPCPDRIQRVHSLMARPSLYLAIKQTMVSLHCARDGFGVGYMFRQTRRTPAVGSGYPPHGTTALQQRFQAPVNWPPHQRISRAKP